MAEHEIADVNKDALLNIDASAIEKFASSCGRQEVGCDLVMTNDEIDKYSAVRHYTATSVTERAPCISSKISELHQDKQFPPEVRTSSLADAGTANIAAPI